MNAVKPDRTGAVSVETLRPHPVRKQEIGPGVIERTTCKLLVKYQLASPPIFHLGANLWTGVIRELGYVLVGGFEKLRMSLPMMLEQPIRAQRPGWVRRQLRSVRSTLAVRLLLPEYDVASTRYPSASWQELSPPGFEASRRLFEFRTDGSRVARLVCHVLAERHGEATEGLLNKFAIVAGKELESSIRMEDEEAGLCLYGRHTAHFWDRQYWEVIIAAADRFPVITVDLKRDSFGNLARESIHGALTPIELSDDARVESPALMPDADFLRGVVERSKVDWEFIVSEIRGRVASGGDLDEAFVEKLARRRLEHARQKFPMEQPGATYESSLGIVREIISLYGAASGSQC